MPQHAERSTTEDTGNTSNRFIRFENRAASLVLAAILCLTLPSPGGNRRALPLNHFPYAQNHAAADGLKRMAVGIADDYFDATSPPARVRRHFEIAHQLGVKYLRCAFSWNAIEKSAGIYDWSFWDRLVTEAQLAGVTLIPYVAYTPRWAASSEKNFWSQPPRDPALYGKFMYQIVSRYKGRIPAWEIWNEPDNDEFWQGSTAGYADLVVQAATGMRRADPAIVLVLGGMSHGPSAFFRELFSKYDLGKYVDVIAMHGYPETWDEERAEETYRDRVRQMSALAAEQAPGTDFWVNEMGYADYRFSNAQASKFGINVYYNYEHTRDYQARFLFKSEVMCLASGRVSLTAWYRIEDFSPTDTHFSDDEVNYHLGLMDSSGKPKPAFYALQFFNKLFDQPVQALRTKSDAISVIDSFRRADGKIVVVGWLRSSLPKEVKWKTGELKDQRKEQVSVPLPCKAVREIRTYSVAGQPGSRATFQSGILRSIALTGSDVFIGVVSCR